MACREKSTLPTHSANPARISQSRRAQVRGRESLCCRSRRLCHTELVVFAEVQGSVQHGTNLRPTGELRSRSLVKRRCQSGPVAPKSSTAIFNSQTCVGLPSSGGSERDACWRSEK